jgi:bacillithiol system protein YtxJ
MNWIPLTSETQLDQIRQLSATKPQLIFKHSTRCSISSMVKNRLERTSPLPAIDFYFLDLILYRSLSDQVAETFQVYHESPQVLLIRNTECIYEESHHGITMEDITEQASAA